MMRCPKAVVCALAAIAGHGLPQAATIVVPNGSFESPVTAFVDTHIDHWQDAPKPAWFPETDETWDSLTGLYKNTDPGSSDRVLNCDGAQAMWLFANPQVAFFQDYETTDWAGTTHAFDARFEVGKAYELTLGALGGGGGMREGASAMLSLYYRTPSNEFAIVASTHIVFTPPPAGSPKVLTDYSVRLPTVRAGDPWANQHIGIQVLSTTFDPELMGGYWDFDNVRLVSIQEPVLTMPRLANNHFSLVLESEPGLQFDILASTDITLPSNDWTAVGTVTNLTGSAPFLDPAPATGVRFYQARQRP